MPVTKENATIYRGGGRRFLTKAAAVNAEADKIIKAKYPTEREYCGNDGRIEDPGFHWRTLPRSDVLYRRLCRMIRKSI